MTLRGRLRAEFLAPLLHTLAAEGVPGEIPVRGTSMRPTLQPGDRLRLVPATAANVRVGDLVVWLGETGPIAHRLVGWWSTRGGRRMLTKGDGASRLDPPLPAGVLVARVVARVRAADVRRLDGVGMRLRGRGRAAVSLAMGLIVEGWDRARRVRRQRAGWRGC